MKLIAVILPFLAVLAKSASEYDDEFDGENHYYELTDKDKAEILIEFNKLQGAFSAAKINPYMFYCGEFGDKDTADKVFATPSLTEQVISFRDFLKQYHESPITFFCFPWDH